MPEALKKLINSISYLPGIGEKSATKLAFFLLKSNKNYIKDLSFSISNIAEKIGYCNDCLSICDIKNHLCKICLDNGRNKNEIVVVEEYLDLVNIEDTGGYKGLYHVLGGAISPINGVFVGDLSFEKLFQRIIESDQKIELILATNPNIEGEATAIYIKEEIEKRKLKHKILLTRLSRGLSSGYIEYADNITLLNAIRERKEI